VSGDAAMAQFITQGRYAAVIDLTDPFAAKISANAYAAAQAAEVAFFQFVRPAWKPLGDDDWHYHDSWEALYKAVKTRHLFVAAGQEALDALHPSSPAYITARMMAPPQSALSDLPENLKIIMGEASPVVGEEEALLRKIKITAVATNLSGGKDNVAKLAAARNLGLSVHLVKRPEYPEGWFGNLKSLYRAVARSLVVVEEEAADKG
jgi:precorrin-6A/cobalt-precorrin-6A reductase